MPRTIAIANNKGGVGKTTTAINLAGALGLQGQGVLLIDLDPQANASLALDVILAPGQMGTRALLGPEAAPLVQCIHDKTPQLAVVPADRSLADLQMRPLPEPTGRTRLRTVLAQAAAYDYVLIDCPPDTGALTQSALVAADEVLIPVDVGYFATQGLQNMLDMMDQIRATYNPDLRLLGVLLTKYDARTMLARDMLATITDAELPVLHPPIRACVDVIRAQMERTPVCMVAPTSTAAADYAALAVVLEEKA